METSTPSVLFVPFNCFNRSLYQIPASGRPIFHLVLSFLFGWSGQAFVILTLIDSVLTFQVQEDMRNGQIELEKYIITKSLTKPPEAYPDARNQPHVEVSLL